MHEGERIALAVASAVIGRVSSCEIQVSHPLVSRRHCRIDATLEGVFVEDLGSSNGTYVNDSAAEGRVRVCSGDVVRIGQEGPEFRLLAGSVDGREVAALDPEAFEKTMMAGDAKLAGLSARVRVAPEAAPPPAATTEASTRKSSLPAGTNPSGTSPSGTSPSGTSPSGTSPAASEPATTGSIPVAVPMDATAEVSPAAPGVPAAPEPAVQSSAPPRPTPAPNAPSITVSVEPPHDTPSARPRAGLREGLIAGLVLGLVIVLAAAVFTPWGQTLPGWAEAAQEAPR